MTIIIIIMTLMPMLLLVPSITQNSGKIYGMQIQHIIIQGGPERMQHFITINNFKKTSDRMNKLYALLRIKFFPQQDNTKIVNFDEGVLILWPFF